MRYCRAAVLLLMRCLHQRYILVPQALGVNMTLHRASLMHVHVRIRVAAIGDRCQAAVTVQAAWVHGRGGGGTGTASALQLPYLANVLHHGSEHVATGRVLWAGRKLIRGDGLHRLQLRVQ